MRHVERVGPTHGREQKPPCSRCALQFGETIALEETLRGLTHTVARRRCPNVGSAGAAGPRRDALGTRALALPLLCGDTRHPPSAFDPGTEHCRADRAAAEYVGRPWSSRRLLDGGASRLRARQALRRKCDAQGGRTWSAISVAGPATSTPRAKRARRVAHHRVVARTRALDPRSALRLTTVRLAVRPRQAARQAFGESSSWSHRLRPDVSERRDCALRRRMYFGNIDADPEARRGSSAT